MQRHTSIALVALLLVAVSAAAQSGGRTVVAQWDRDSFVFTSTDNDNSTDIVEYRFDASLAALDIVAETFGGSAHWKLRWISLVEFQDLDDNGVYNLGDPILQQLRFDEMVLPTVSVQQSDVEIVATVTYRHPSNFDDVVHLTFRIVEHIPPEGPLQSPLQLRWTMAVDDFPFETDNETMLGIEHRWTQTLRSTPAGAEDQEGPIIVQHSWDDGADVDGDRRPIEATVQSYARDADGETIVIMTIPKGQHIDHDAHLSLAAAQDEEPLTEAIIDNIQGSWPLYLAGILGAGVVLGYPLWIRRGGTS